MSANLANILAFIKKNKTDMDTLYATPMSYIKTFSKNDLKIIFLFRQNNFKKLAKSLSPVENYSNDNLDLTGSPLKDECQIDFIDTSINFKLNHIIPWTDIEEQYNAIELTETIHLFNELNEVHKQFQPPPTGSVWALCDGSDVEKTILIENEFIAGWKSRGIVFFKGLLSEEDIKIENFLSTHLSFVKNVTKLETQIEVFFNINSNLTIKVFWTTSVPVPSLTLYKKGDVMLYQTIPIVNDHSLAHDFWCQLIVLNMLYNDICCFKKEEEPKNEPNYRYGCGMDVNVLKEKILTIFTEVPLAVDIGESNSNIELEGIVMKAKNRDYADVTDNLWDLLKSCSSYKELKIALIFVFQCAAKSNVINMPTNENHLAQLIREVSQHRLAIPCLSGTEPLELLLEIGLQKISKDYEYIFTESKICSAKDLKLNEKDNMCQQETVLHVRKSLFNANYIRETHIPRKTLLHDNNVGSYPHQDLIGFQNSFFNKNEIEYKIAKLAQIHLILEHLLSIQINLNLENVYSSIAENLLDQPILPFEKLSSLRYNKLDIPIQNEQILQIIENKTPHARKITMYSENKLRQIQNTFYHSLDPIFPPDIFSSDCHNDEKDTTKEILYWNYHYLKIRTQSS